MRFLSSAFTDSIPERSHWKYRKKKGADSKTHKQVSTSGRLEEQKLFREFTTMHRPSITAAA
jgi:hypothetical protein